ncbi:MAG TPA: carboxypeptidase-like regulatory domain-containing protein [Bryobacteraceae bacterium]|jgi:hypothetical protein|nr:carboxypeptidase-like regulatory domain-containing protein [Bryobacteraceae bacterium]
MQPRLLKNAVRPPLPYGRGSVNDWKPVPSLLNRACQEAFFGCSQRRELRAALLAFFLLFAMWAPATAAETKTTIRVNVKNQYDKPVENAAVILDFLGGRSAKKFGFHSKMHWEVKTNMEGRAHFPPVPEGTVQLQVITQRYQTYGKKVEVAGEEKVFDITLNPPQKQYSAHPPLKPADAPKN